jgi:RNA polymerase sigma-70 factor (ECF subfamily)
MRSDPAELIEACRRGERWALEAVFRAESPALERLLGRLVGPRSDVEDLLQATLVTALKAFPGFRGEASVRTWLARIAVRIAQAEFGRSRVRRATGLTLVETPSEPRPSPDELADQKRRVTALYRQLDRLTPKLRVAFLLHVCEGLSIAEVAALVGASRAATKSRVFLARHALLSYARRDRVLKDWLETEENRR